MNGSLGRTMFGMFRGVIIINLFIKTTAITEHLNFEMCYDVMDVNENMDYTISWTGHHISSNCKVRFHGYNTEHTLNDYKVCIKATKWVVSGTEVTLKYYSSPSNFKEQLKEKFTRNSYYVPTTRWCSGSNEYVDVQLTTLPYDGHIGSIELEVTAIITWNHNTIVALSCGVSAGVTIIITIIVIMLCLLSRRRRTQKTETVNDNYFTVDNYDTQQVTATQVSHLRFSKCSPPSTSISKSHQWGRLNTATLEHEQDYSTHPPSYESVVSSSNTAKTAYSVVFSTGISDTYGQINRGGHYGTGVHNIEHIDDRLPTTIS